MTREIDVRRIEPMDRHRKIFDVYANLEPGESFELINDHDPRPLHYEFERIHPGRFSWTYLEQGPVEWRVEIARL